MENYFIDVFKGKITLLKRFIVTLNILILYTRYWRNDMSSSLTFFGGRLESNCTFILKCGPMVIYW